MNRTPKEKFLASAHRKPFEDIIANSAFEEATLIALLELQMEQPLVGDPAKHWDAFSRLAGARRFLEILRTLHEPIEKPKRDTSGTLNYGAK